MLKVLDMFCGAWGWSIPFLEYGDEVWGIDMKNLGVPKNAHFIQKDIRFIKGDESFKGFDLIIGSPPCVDFSNARFRSIWIHKKKPNPEKGLELVHEFERIVKEAQPKIYLMENIRELEKYYKEKPIWRFFISKGGKRSLWGNIEIPFANDFRFKHKIRDIPGWDKTRFLRAKIPYNIAKFIADYVHCLLEKKKFKINVELDSIHIEIEEEPELCSYQDKICIVSSLCRKDCMKLPKLKVELE